MKLKKRYSVLVLNILALLFWHSTYSQQPPPGPMRWPSLPTIPVKGDTTHTLAKHFIVGSPLPKTPDSKGFIQRWLVLEPIKKDIVRNNIFTEAYLRDAFASNSFSDDFTVVPQKGSITKVGEQELKWHALDSKMFNFNLYHFTYALNQPRYGILVWLTTVINCIQDIDNVRLTAGCNSGSMWWVNGQETLLLSGDRDMIIDNAASERISLKKGKNIIRGAVINGPGIANFAVRFIDEKGNPVRNFTISYQ